MNTVSERAIVLFTAFSFVACFSPGAASAQPDEGEKLFNQICVACHTVGKGRLVGPDLANVHKRRPEEWILRFVKNSTSVIDSGDEYAVQLFAEYSNIPMPPNNFTDRQIRSIIQYIAANSPDDGAAEASRVADAMQPPSEPATAEDILAGKALFTGELRLKNGGATCITCHNVDRADIPAGGALARDLTNAHSRLGEAGVMAILTSPPFPAMNKAFAKVPLTRREVFQITAFLQSMDVASSKGPNYGTRLFVSGLGGAILLLGLFSGVWVRGKRRSVNHEIYDRQVRATWQRMSDSERNG